MSDSSSHSPDRPEDPAAEEAQLKAASTAPTPQASGVNPTWLQRQRCRLLSRLGHTMVNAGERLQQYGLSRSMPVERPQDL
jgi:hypothetical protein